MWFNLGKKGIHIAFHGHLWRKQVFREMAPVYKENGEFIKRGKRLKITSFLFFISVIH